MTKNKIIRLRIWLTFFLITLILSGCNITPSYITNIQTETATVAYIHYSPPQEFNIHLEFDYPNSWVLVEITEYMSMNLRIISLLDPRSAAAQTPPPIFDGSHPPEDDFGRVSIIVKPLELGHTPETEIKTYKKKNGGINGVILLSDFKITIDGYDTSVVESQFGPVEGYPSLMFNRLIFFVVDDQLYEIDFTISEKERGGEFEKGYEYFFKSLKIVP